MLEFIFLHVGFQFFLHHLIFVSQFDVASVFFLPLLFLGSFSNSINHCGFVVYF